jgi:mono/diheme cytochrome c family protein
VQRGFTEDYINQTIRNGLPGTRMPGFSSGLSGAELNAVIAYVDSLNGITPTRGYAPEGRAENQLPPEAAKGRELFSDAVRGFSRCSTCHDFAGRGIPVASPIAAIPADVTALKQLATPAIRTATVAGDTFPALVLGEGKNQVKLYDFGASPPVLRTLAPASVQLKAGSSWRHSSVLSAYSNADLQAILAFLRAAAAKQP